MLALLAAIRFTLEMVALVAVGAAGWHAPLPLAGRVVAAVLAVALVAAVWGRFVAPRSPQRLPPDRRLPVELVVFATAAAAIAVVRTPAWGAVYAVLALICSLLVWRLQPEGI